MTYLSRFVDMSHTLVSVIRDRYDMFLILVSAIQGRCDMSLTLVSVA